MSTDIPRHLRRIAIVDHEVNEQSPSGSCHLRLLDGLCDEFDFTVFSSAFDNPRPSRINWVRVPALRRPLVARFISFYASSWAYRQREVRRHGPFDLVQAIENYTSGPTVSYVHYCHRAYLKRHWTESAPPGLRGKARHVDHLIRAWTEPRALRSARLVVVPSAGLADDLGREYGINRKLRIIANPVDTSRFCNPQDGTREAVRRRLNFADGELVVAFVALGHFERKGLPQLLQALQAVDKRVRLIVIGGQHDLVAAYRAKAKQMGLSERVTMVGLQSDVRPFLWAADAFAAPSSYEVFALAPLQAAAAGLPLVVTTVQGVAPFFREGEHGFAVTREPSSIAVALSRLLESNPERRQSMGELARRAIAPYGVEHFVDSWRRTYQDLLVAE